MENIKNSNKIVNYLPKIILHYINYGLLTQSIYSTIFICVLFFCLFSDVFCWFCCEITEKALKWTKKVENDWKKCFDQLLGAHSTQKLVKIHNTLVTFEINSVEINRLQNWRIKNNFQRFFDLFKSPRSFSVLHIIFLT